jgi:succinate-acetate transporter protein
VSLGLWSVFMCRRSVGFKTATPGSSLVFPSLFLCFFVLTPVFNRAKTACPYSVRVAGGVGGLNPPAIFATPLADCTSDPPGGLV